MSMHEFEDLVEWSVRVLDACDDAPADLRSMFHHLYQFQAMFDTGFTHMRVIDTLVKHRFVYRMDMSQHPDYAKYQAKLDAIAEYSRTASSSMAFQWIRIDPPREENRDMSREERYTFYRSNPIAGFYRYPYLYAEAGSPLWQRMVDTGTLTGADALPPNPDLKLVDIVDAVVRCAEKQENFEVILLWYTLLTQYYASLDSAERVVTPALESMIATVNRSDAMKRAAERTPWLASFANMIAPVKTGAEYLEKIEKLAGDYDDL